MKARTLKQQSLATVIDTKSDVILRLKGSCWADVLVEVLCIQACSKLVELCVPGQGLSE